MPIAQPCLSTMYSVTGLSSIRLHRIRIRDNGSILGSFNLSYQAIIHLSNLGIFVMFTCAKIKPGGSVCGRICILFWPDPVGCELCLAGSGSDPASADWNDGKVSYKTIVLYR